MAKMKSGVRSLTAHRPKEQSSVQLQNRTAASKPKNTAWEQDRRDMEKKGLVKKGDGKDVIHKKPLSQGGTNSPGNLSVGKPAGNRGHGMSPGGTKKGTTARKKNPSNPYTKR